MTSSGTLISLPSPFSNGDSVEWFQRFELCSQANDWGAEMKAKKLLKLLEGGAIAVWFELMSEEQDTYNMPEVKIIKRMVPACLVSLADFHKRTLLPGELLSIFAHGLKRLVEQALPTPDAGTSKKLLLHQFNNGLPISISTQLHTGGQINDLKTAMEQTKLLMMLKEKPEGAAVLKDQISTVTEQVAALTAKQTRQLGMQCATSATTQATCKDTAVGKKVLCLWTI